VIQITFIFYRAPYNEREIKTKEMLKMADIKNLERQHIEIRELMNELRGQVNQGFDKSYLEANVNHIVKNINILSGKLKIHMSTEDRYLYPAMKISENAKLRKAESVYSDEMLKISKVFVAYKTDFNTKTKVLSNVTSFLNESREVLNHLEKRMDKEDHELYPEFKKS